MKSHISVLIDSSATSLIESLKLALEPHRLNEDDLDNPESIRAWDYWFFADDWFAELALKGLAGELTQRYPEDSEELLNNSAFVRNLPEGYSTSGIITPDGKWHDLQDFGWGLIKDPCPENDRAEEAWAAKTKELFAAHQDHICIAVVLHT